MAGFDGLNVLITGAGTGLGAATAIGIARQGGRVIINYAASQREAEATADVCRTAGGEARVAQGNVADDADCRRIAALAADWGRLDALINNAAATELWRMAIWRRYRPMISIRCTVSTRLDHSRWCEPLAPSWKLGHAPRVGRHRWSTCRQPVHLMVRAPLSPTPPARRR